jgi:hypothetical protein
MAREKSLLESDLYMRFLTQDMRPPGDKVLWTDDFSNLIEVLDRE